MIDWLAVFRNSRVCSVAGSQPLDSWLTSASFTRTNWISKFMCLNAATQALNKKLTTPQHKSMQAGHIQMWMHPSFLEIKNWVKLSMSTQTSTRPSTHQGGAKCKPGIALFASPWVCFLPKCKNCSYLRVDCFCQTMPVYSGMHYFPLDLFRSWRRTTSHFNILKHKAT